MLAFTFMSILTFSSERIQTSYTELPSTINRYLCFAVSRSQISDAYEHRNRRCNVVSIGSLHSKHLMSHCMCCLAITSCLRILECNVKKAKIFTVGGHLDDQTAMNRHLILPPPVSIPYVALAVYSPSHSHLQILLSKKSEWEIGCTSSKLSSN